MNVHVSYKLPKSPDIEQEINRHTEKLRRRLQVFRPDLVHLKAILEENSAREGFVVSLDLKLPSGDIAARESAPTAVAAIKGAFDDLIEQVSKHKDRLRAQYQWPRRRRVGRIRPTPQVPFEETIAAVQPPTISQEDISSWVNANLPRLQRFVARELRYRESIGELQPYQLRGEEVIDETIANALDHEEKPEKLALEAWLYRLALQAIRDLSGRTGENVLAVSLDQPARMSDFPSTGSDEPGLQFHHPDEAVTHENLIANRGVASPEESAAGDEMITLVEAALLGSNRVDREAFLLFGVEGFSPEEISVITNRPIDQVRNSIRAAREHLRRSLPVPDEFKDKLLQQTKIA